MRYSKKGEQVYFDCPGLGLRGRRRGTGCGERLLGLDSLLTDPCCKQATVLDCGCAEGLIGLEFAQRGAAAVHGFDLQDVSIDAALRLSARSLNPVLIRYETAEADVARQAPELSSVFRGWDSSRRNAGVLPSSKEAFLEGRVREAFFTIYEEWDLPNPT